MPQLDALRAFAVLAVFVHHFLKQTRLPESLRLSWGHHGVSLFFVLSGFLITGILIRARDATAAGPDRRHVARQFYVRRFLRIFPLYYLVVFLGLAFGVQAFLDNTVSLLTYTFNFKVAAQNWFPDHIAHLWSLAVEEQFYVFWPWVVLFVSARRLPWWVAAMIVAAPLWRVIALVTEMKGLAWYVATPACLDTLGIGALLAVVSKGGAAPENVRHVLTRYLLPGSVLMLLLFDGKFGDFPGLPILSSLFDQNLFSDCILLDCGGCECWFHGIGGPGASITRIAVLGAYCLWSLCLPLAVGYPDAPCHKVFGPGMESGGYAFLFAASAATIAVASLSWYCFERPINNLKKHFEYTRNSKGGMATSESRCPLANWTSTTRDYPVRRTTARVHISLERQRGRQNNRLPGGMVRSYRFCKPFVPAAHIGEQRVSAALRRQLLESIRD